MLYIVLAMLVILGVAAAVVLYVAYPHRGQQLPAAPWLGDAMERAADAMPLLEPQDGEEHQFVDLREGAVQTPRRAGPVS